MPDASLVDRRNETLISNGHLAVRSVACIHQQEILGSRFLGEYLLEREVPPPISTGTAQDGRMTPPAAIHTRLGG